MSTSFLNEDGSVATIVLNSRDEEIAYRFFVGEKEVKLSIPARAIQTLVY